MGNTKVQRLIMSFMTCLLAELVLNHRGDCRANIQEGTTFMLIVHVIVL